MEKTTEEMIQEMYEIFVKMKPLIERMEKLDKSKSLNEARKAWKRDR